MPGNDTRQPAIAFLPYTYKVKGRLGNVLLDELSWPLGRPAALMGTTVADLTQVDHLVVQTRSWVYGFKPTGLSVNLSVQVFEPRAYHRKHLFLASLFRSRFYRIITCDAKLLASTPNGMFMAYGDTWVPDWERKNQPKTKMLSLIASKKKSLRGHKLRHRLVKWIRKNAIDADILGRGYKTIDDKATGLAPYRYSAVIENSREPGYLSEKLIDALLLKTVPIYWGAPDIGDFFDLDGMVVCETEAQMQAAIRNNSEADYNARLEAVDRNQKTAQAFINPELRAARLLLATL